MYSLDSSFLKKTYKGHQLVACDGSDISLPMEQGKGWDYVCHKRENQKEYFQMHTSAMYDLVNRRYLEELLISKELLLVYPGRRYKRNLKAHLAVSFLYRTS